ncbi:SDR family oxidoreductase [Bauldia sp.]|uniref:SDR family oxidoreductase n=1 Tax=Bauldia sp. TaxID=2575872 RepID=UPI003BAB536A
MRLFVFGLGYSATTFAKAIVDKAESIGGTVRTPEKAARLRAAGIDALVFDGTEPGPGVTEAVGQATHLVISIAPGEAGDPVLAHYADAIAAAPKLEWIGYLSTVGIYGGHDGEWVDEDTPPRPRPGRSANRLAAEQAWTDLADAKGCPLGVFRIAGIYGPGRNAFVNLAAGKARRVVKPGQVFNRIHVADIAGTLVAAASAQAPGIYNLADDEPAPPQDVVAFAADLMGVAPPPEVPFAEADLTPMARSFYGDNKRVANRRIKEDLGVRLAYPTYRDGLTALWRDGTWRRPD